MNELTKKEEIKTTAVECWISRKGTHEDFEKIFNYLHKNFGDVGESYYIGSTQSFLEPHEIDIYICDKNLNKTKQIAKAFYKTVKTANKSEFTKFYVVVSNISKFISNKFIKYFLTKYLNTFCKTIVKKYNCEEIVNGFVKLDVIKVKEKVKIIKKDEEISKKEKEYLCILLKKLTGFECRWILNNVKNHQTQAENLFLSCFINSNGEKIIFVKMKYSETYREWEKQLNFILNTIKNFK